MPGSPLSSVAICGSGLALWMGAAALARALPQGCTLTAVDLGGDADWDADWDALYGAVLPPDYYSFHTGIGLPEPELLQHSRAGFCWGTALSGWTTEHRGWVQGFHTPLPVIDGVALDKIVKTVPGATLQDVLVTPELARRGVFAHPPEDPAHPLSRAEYGYAVDIAELAGLYQGKAVQYGAAVQSGTLGRVHRDGKRIVSVELADGTRIAADLFVDASGPPRVLAGPAAIPADARRVRFTAALTETPAAPAPVRRLAASPSGWTATTPLRGARHTLTLSHSDAGDAGHVVALGRVGPAWHGNVVAIGTAAGALDPVSVAPLRGLLRDVRRLLGLLPVSTDCTVEARQFNRAQGDDLEHAALFGDAYYAELDLPDTPFWRDADRAPAPKLARKLSLYTARGYLVAYDREPFDALDWAVLHEGVGRRSRRADRLALEMGEGKARDVLAARRRQIEALAAKMPPHPVYLSKLVAYLARKHPVAGAPAGQRTVEGVT